MCFDYDMFWFVSAQGQRASCHDYYDNNYDYHVSIYKQLKPNLSIYVPTRCTINNNNPSLSSFREFVYIVLFSFHSHIFCFLFIIALKLPYTLLLRLS